MVGVAALLVAFKLDFHKEGLQSVFDRGRATHVVLVDAHRES